MLLDLDAIFDPDRQARRPGRGCAPPAGCPACGHPHRIDTPADLPSEWYLVWDERAAIMEFDGGATRERAEHFALLDVIGQMRRAGCSVTTNR
ncbi:MAG: hypothetical protein C0501_06965 [Isosphaera sp.]|nr:hypothetical protein [Isosphaera sp.]